MKRPILVNVTLLAAALPSCLLPAVDDKDSTNSPDAMNSAEAGTTDASADNQRLDANVDGALVSVNPVGDDAASVSTETAHGGATSSDVDAGSTSDSGTITVPSTDAGNCGAWDEPCCASAPVCESAFECRSDQCQPPVQDLARAFYSRVPPDAQVAELEFVEFTATIKRTTANSLLSRPTITSLVGSTDGARIAFLANDSVTLGSPEVVWLLDNVNEGNTPFKVGSSNPALARTALLADANLDYLLSCTGIEPCGQLELYRRAQKTFHTIATDVWSLVVGAENGILVYLAEDGTHLYWVDLTETIPTPRLLATAKPNRLLWIQPGMVAKRGRGVCFFDAEPNELTRRYTAWSAYAVHLGATTPIEVATGDGIISCNIDDDGESVLVGLTSEQFESKLLRSTATASGFGTTEELFRQQINLEGPSEFKPRMFVTPLIDTYNQYFSFFGTPNEIVDGTVKLSTYVADLETANYHSIHEQLCEVIPSGHFTASPRVGLSPSATRTGSALAWMHCNGQLGHVDLSQPDSFTTVELACANCSPWAFSPVGEGVVYSEYSPEAVLSPYYYVTRDAPPLSIIGGESDIGKVPSLIVAQASEQLSATREVWHPDGALSVTIPREWLTHSEATAPNPTLGAGLRLDLAANPLADQGIVVAASRSTDDTPEQMVEPWAERNACTQQLNEDSGTLVANDGTSYDFHAESRTNCADGAGTRWVVAMRTHDHSVRLAYHDPLGTSDLGFYEMAESIHVDTRLLPELSATEGDAGP